MTVPKIQLKCGRMVKLGRRAPRANRKVPPIAAFFDPARVTTPPPASTNWRAKAAAAINRVYLNDQYGDCVIAGKYHQIGLWTGNDTPAAALADDKEVYAAYQEICGPGDEGCIITDVLDHFRDRGLKVAGRVHKIDGYAAVDWTNKLMVQCLISIFGGALTLGINLPSQWTCTNCDWTDKASGNVGGHDVCVLDYDQKGVQIATWGGVVTITWPAFLSKRWIEECYVELSPDWYNDDRLSPSGFDVAGLQAALQQAGGGVVPDPAPVTPPTPTPPPTPPTPPPTGNLLVLTSGLAAGSYGIGQAAGVLTGNVLKASLSPAAVAKLEHAGINFDLLVHMLLAGLESSAGRMQGRANLSWQEWLQLILEILQALMPK